MMPVEPVLPDPGRVEGGASVAGFAWFLGLVVVAVLIGWGSWALIVGPWEDNREAKWVRNCEALGGTVQPLGTERVCLLNDEVIGRRG